MVGLVVTAVAANVGFAAWLAVERSARAAEAALSRVREALATSRVPLTTPVVEAIGRLAGCELMVIAGARSDGTFVGPAISTLPAEEQASLQGHFQGRKDVGIGVGAVVATDADEPVRGSTQRLLRDRSARETPQSPRLLIGTRRYRAALVCDAGSLGEHVIVLSPEEPLFRATWEAVWPTAAVAAATLAVLVPAGYRAVRRLSRRFEAVERQVARIADGEFGSRVEQTGDGCVEIDRLADGVNTMSLALARLRESLVAGERQRMLGQLAAGFAHELRNAVTGARLAIELHARRCQKPPHDGAGGRRDDSLPVALRQLALLEGEVDGLLALAREGRRPPPDRFDMGGVVREVADLVGPRCAHAGVSLECRPPAADAALVPSGSGPWLEGRREGLRSALLNVVLNAVEAAGRGGRVRIETAAEPNRVVVGVEDTGPGPPEAIRDSLTEPFVTTKPEGLGLGLAVARAVALEHGGSLDWGRLGDCTRFTLSLPVLAACGGGRSAIPRPAESAGPAQPVGAKLA